MAFKDDVKNFWEDVRKFTSGLLIQLGKKVWSAPEPVAPPAKCRTRKARKGK